MTPFQQLYLGLGGAKKTYVDDLFSAYVYSGTGSSRSITNGIDLSGEGGMTWIKNRTDNADGIVTDTVRGANNSVDTNNNIANNTQTNQLTAFNSNGFTLSTDAYVNGSSAKYVSYSFRRSEGFFDVITWTGNGVNGRDIPHNLGSVPGFIMIKRYSAGEDWACFHRSLGNTKGLTLNNNQASGTKTWWDETSPTATTFRIDNANRVNTNGETYVAYVFAHDDQSFGDGKNASVVKCDTYTGNGSSEGPEINLGWEPQWLMIKRTDADENWTVYDTMRGISVGSGYDKQFKPDINNSESGSLNRLELRSYGFKIKSGDGDINVNSGTYVYVAIRRPDGFVGKPYGDSAATDVFTMDSGNASTTQAFTSGFPVDFALTKRRPSNSSWEVTARMMQEEYLLANDTNQIATFDKLTFDDMTGWNIHNAYNSDWQSYMWKRQGKGFDVVHYLGNSSAGKTVQHGLNAVPEMIWVKRRDNASNNWAVYHKGANGGTTPQNYKLFLNETNAEATDTTYWNDTAPTSTVFSVGTSNVTNGGGDSHMAFLFSSVTGVSKLGYYTGDGGTSNAVDCGFQPRFVIIKRVDTTGDWKVWDTLGGNGMMRLNTNNQSYNDVLRSFTSTGFTLISPDGTVNANNGKYIFYAHA